MEAGAKNENGKWQRNTVVYQIYPLSFKDSNGDGKGDLSGIIEKLDYLNDGTAGSLGIGAIWLSPIYKSPMADFGYDVADYYDIDPVFGDLASFDKLIKAAHDRGIRVIVDFVPNHSSSQHPWFIKSRQSRNNPKRDWYIWRDPKPDGSPPNNWLSAFGGSAWTYDEATGQYYLHSFLEQQPDLNWWNPDVVAEMQNVLRFWLKRGVDGFRLDAIDNLAKDKALRDEPPNPDYSPGKDDPYQSLLHVHSKNRLEVIPTIENLCGVVPPDRFMVGEISPTLAELPQFYTACIKKIHIPFNFNLINLAWDAAAFRAFIDRYDRVVGPNELPNYVLGNHDQPRLVSRIGRESARIAAMLLLSLRGVPFIYYGQEIGMEDGTVPPARVQDPWGQHVSGFGLGRDPERTPMQWNTAPYAGFSEVEPWLPIPRNFKDYNVEVESANPNSLLNLYRRLIHYRNNSAALTVGSYQSLDLPQSNVFAFTRKAKGQEVLVVLNFSDQAQTVSFDFADAKLVCDTGLEKAVGTALDITALALRPHEGYVLEL